MSMPTIPDEPERPDRKEVTIDLLESIALEEIALSHLINAESEKVRAFVGNDLDFPTHPTNKEIIKFNRGVTQLLETIVMKEWLLLKKIENVIEFHENNREHRKRRRCKCEPPCIECFECKLPECQCRCNHQEDISVSANEVIKDELSN